MVAWQKIPQQNSDVRQNVNECCVPLTGGTLRNTIGSTSNARQQASHSACRRPQPEMPEMR